MQTKYMTVEIKLVQNNHPKHIVLGKRNFWYRNGNIYRIIEGEKLLKEILSLVEKYEHLNERSANMIFPSCCLATLLLRQKCRQELQLVLISGTLGEILSLVFKV